MSDEAARLMALRRGAKFGSWECADGYDMEEGETPGMHLNMRCFSWKEVACKHSAFLPAYATLVSDDFATLLRLLRHVRQADPLIVRSWYRDPTHPIEAAKHNPGAHATGLAVDVHAYGARASSIIHNAFRFAVHSGIEDRLRIGVAQTGDRARRFIHLDICGPAARWFDSKAGHYHYRQFPSPTIWSY